MSRLVFLAALALTSALVAWPSSAAKANTPANVILITWDGVRYEEVFQGEDAALGGQAGSLVFPSLWSLAAGPGAILTGQRPGSDVAVSNPHHVSLPAYQSILAGSTQPCANNDCGRIRAETFPERLVASGLPRAQVAVLASWKKISLAAESREGTVFTNSGIEPLVDPVSGESDAELQAINRAQAAEKPPWWDARYDRYTWAHAMRYLRAHRPRFLYISLNDPDERAHRGEYTEYLQSLRRADTWLGELRAQLSQMGDYGRDSVILISTDHGRGKGSMWKDHAASIENSRWIWVAGVDSSGRDRLRPIADAARFQHNDLRGWIERLVLVGR
ncbi:MAG: alkaline phosphatase family protein [Bdellovibrionales bacterium]|nr:alkaline phosphatase family protein [Bdellovibrionales bacterium]